MKKIIFLILLIISLASCTNDTEPIIEQDYTNCIVGELDVITTSDQILGEWKLTRARVLWPDYINSDFSNENIIYNFKPDGVLVISGAGTEKFPLSFPDGEYTYEFEHIDTWDETVWRLRINPEKWNSNWTHTTQNELMVLSQSSTDGSDLCFKRN